MPRTDTLVTWHERRNAPLPPGFARDAVLHRAGEIVESRARPAPIRHFFLVGGCDGARPGRNYYTEFASSRPRRTPCC